MPVGSLGRGRECDPRPCLCAASHDIMTCHLPAHVHASQSQMSLNGPSCQLKELRSILLDPDSAKTQRSIKLHPFKASQAQSPDLAAKMQPLASLAPIPGQLQTGEDPVGGSQRAQPSAAIHLPALATSSAFGGESGAVPCASVCCPLLLLKSKTVGSVSTALRCTKDIDGKNKEF